MCRSTSPCVSRCCATIASMARMRSNSKLELRAAVCSPAGSTIEGVAVLEDYSLHAAVMEALKASYERTLELGK